MTTNARANARLFHRAHHNILAAQIRRQFEIYMSNAGGHSPALNSVFVVNNLALALAARLLEDNDNFEPIEFLNACSPNQELYPLSELWEDYIGSS